VSPSDRPRAGAVLIRSAEGGGALARLVTGADRTR
jgi:hypothetical protein